MTPSLLCDAYALAARFHREQEDKVGEPYLWHVLRVAAAVREDGHTYEAVGVLHDVIEDTDATEADIAPFGPDVVAGVLAMTKTPGDDYFDDYLPRVMANPIAKVVKLADLKDNVSRLYECREETAVKLVTKYVKAYGVLTG